MVRRGHVFIVWGCWCFLLFDGAGEAGVCAGTTSSTTADPQSEPVHALGEWSLVFSVWLGYDQKFTAVAAVVPAPDPLPGFLLRRNVATLR